MVSNTVKSECSVRCFGDIRKCWLMGAHSEETMALMGSEVRMNVDMLKTTLSTSSLFQRKKKLIFRDPPSETWAGLFNTLVSIFYHDA